MDSLEPSLALAALLQALESAELGCTLLFDRPEGMERVYANAALARIVGIDLEAMRAMAPMAALPPAQRERLMALRAASTPSQPVPASLVSEITRPDGTRIPVEIKLGYTQIDGERAVFLFVRDVSAQAAMEAALRESEDRFRHMAEACPDSITIYSNGKCTYANPEALRRLGITSPEQLGGIDQRAMVPADREAEVAERGARLLAGENVPPLELAVVGLDGKETVFESSLKLTSIGGARATISYTRDITERKRLQAEVMKRDRFASVGLLAAGVAHELNNPLMALGMQVRWLLGDADAQRFSPEVREALDQMDEATRRMQTIIADLLFMTRSAEMPQAHVDVGKILASTVALLRAGTAPCPAIDVAVEPLPPIHGYASKLGQIFLNVLRNAVQAVDGAANPAVRVSGRVAAGGVEVVVTDNGPGIPRDVLPRLAQPFFTTKPHGTGLGLWISQTLVAQHGGKLEIASRDGEGTTVTVWVPQTLPAAG